MCGLGLRCRLRVGGTGVPGGLFCFGLLFRGLFLEPARHPLREGRSCSELARVIAAFRDNVNIYFYLFFNKL
jgi:hypothetical protein